MTSRVRRFERSPLLVVTHDQRDQFYGYVEACKEFRSLLTADLLYYAYVAAGREFTDCLMSTFIVLSDGGQPVVTFHAHTVARGPVVPSGAVQAVAPVVAAATARRGCLLESLTSGPSSPGPSLDPRKRPGDSLIEATAVKRNPSAIVLS